MKFKIPQPQLGAVELPSHFTLKPFCETCGRRIEWGRTHGYCHANCPRCPHKLPDDIDPGALDAIRRGTRRHRKVEAELKEKEKTE